MDERKKNTPESPLAGGVAGRKLETLIYYYFYNEGNWIAESTCQAADNKCQYNLWFSVVLRSLFCDDSILFIF